MREVPCANCGAAPVHHYPTASYAPFLLDRVFGIQPESLGERLGAADLARTQRATLWLFRCILGCFPLGRRFLGYRGRARTILAACPECGFLGPAAELAETDIGNLYRDYRSPGYNADRIRYEPEYAALAPVIGRHGQEVRERLSHVDGFLGPILDCEGIRTVLDWGGGDGSFIPVRLRNRAVTVLDLCEDARPPSPYRFTATLAPGEGFDYIQLCHVLEHLRYPRKELEGILCHLNPGGYLYLEVPYERTPEDLEGLRRGDPRVHHLIHEHLNLYDETSLAALGRSLGLRLEACARVKLECGYASVQTVSAVFQVAGRLGTRAE
jgi:hypothetical protein